MKNKLLLTLIGLVAFTSSCQDDFLEEKVYTFQAPKDYYSNEVEVKAATNGMYEALMTWDLFVQPAWIAVALENDDMLGQDWVSGGYGGIQNGQWYIERPWKGFYQVVNRANIIIDRVSPLAFLSPELKDAVLGQAYFLRGYCYMEIGRWFGDAPLRTRAYDPAVDSPDLARSPRKDVFLQAAADLELAASLLPASYDAGAYTDADRGRPTAPAAWGLLSKVYMHLAGAEVGESAYFSNALQAARKVKEMADAGFPALEPDYMAVFDQATQDLTDEILFSVQATQAPNEGPELPRYYIPGNTNFAGGGGIGAISLREDFYATFEPGDKRVAFGSALFDQWVDLNGTQYYNFKRLPPTVVGILEENVFNNGYGRFGDNVYLLNDGTEVRGTPRIYIKKYMDPTSQVKDENGTNPIILRYADVLLLLAEAGNEVDGPTQEAYDAINEVRQRAGLPALAAGLSQAEFRQKVRDERRHELYAEFQRRWDLIRWGNWLETMAAANRPRQEYQKLFPIATEEIASNALITENNPGW